MDKPVANSIQLAARGRLVYIAGGAEGSSQLVRFPGLAVHYVHCADAEVVRHVLLEAEQGNRKLCSGHCIVEQNCPVVLLGLLLAVGPHLVLDAALVSARAAECHGAGKLHICVADVDDRIRQAGALLPDDNRDKRLDAPAHPRTLRHKRRIDLTRRVVFGLNPVGRANPPGIAALVDPSVKCTCADLLSANDKSIVLSRLVVRNRML